jgi:Helix-turn-helix
MQRRMNGLAVLDLKPDVAVSRPRKGPAFYLEAMMAVPVESEAARALAWRKAQKLSRAQLSAKTGFSTSQIQDYEIGFRRGKTGAAAELTDAVWLRYRLACAAIARNLKPAW